MRVYHYHYNTFYSLNTYKSKSSNCIPPISGYVPVPKPREECHYFNLQTCLKKAISLQLALDVW